MVIGRAEFPRPFLQKMRCFRKTDSPRAKWRVPFGKSIGRFWRVHFLSGKMVQKIADSCQESILVFMGMCGGFFPINMAMVKHRSFVLGDFVTESLSQSEGPCLGNPSVSSNKYVFCSETSSTQNLESQVTLI